MRERSQNERKAHLLETINTFVSKLIRASSVQESTWSVVKNAVEKLGYIDCIIYLINDDGKLYQCATHGRKKTTAQDIQSPIKLKIGEGICGHVALTGVGEIIADTSKDPRYLVDEEDRYSEITVPVISDGIVIGVIDSEHPEKGYFSDHDLNILTEVASMLSLKISQIKALEEKDKWAEKLTIANEKLTFQNEENEKKVVKLKQSQDRFNLLLQASEDMITVHQPNGKYLYYNGPACYAITPKDLVGKMPNDVFDKDISNTLLDAFERVAKTGESETLEVFFDWQGEKRWFSEYIFPVKSADGKVLEIVKVCKDIHLRKLAEQKIESQNNALLESDKAHREVLKASSDLISVIDENGKILFVNHASIKVYGLLPNKCLGRSVFDFTHPEDIEYTKTKFVDWRNSEGSNFYFENRQINASGKTLDTEWHVNVERKGPEIIKITSIVRDITKQNITYRELVKANKEREEFYNLFKRTPDIMVITDPKGVLMLANPATISLLGYSKKELKLKRFVDFIHPDEKETALSEINRQIKVNSTAINASHFICKNNEYLLLSYSIYFNKKEGVSYCTARDITNKRLIETELVKSKEHAEESEERFRLLMMNMETGVVVHAPDTSIVLNNIRASEILGLSNQKLRGKKAIDPVWNFVKSDKSPLPFKEYPVNRIATSKKAIKSEVIGVIRPHKEDIVWLTVNGYPALSNTGEISEIVISFIDITEQKHIEEDKLLAISELRNTEKRLNEAQKLAHVGSWFYCLLSQKREWSDETFDIWGFDPKKAPPEFDALVKRVHTDYEELFISADDKVTHLGIPYDIEHRIHLLNGEQKTIRAICKPAFGDTGKVVGLSGTTQDITEQKQAKEDKLLAIVNLESKVKFRTQELEESLEREKELGILKTNFVSMASHEFRTPLTSIKATSDVILRYFDKLSRDDIDERLGKIKSEVEDMTVMLEDILIIGKSESQKLHYDPNTLDIVSLIKRIITEYQLSESENRNIVYTISSPIIEVLADKKWIKHIVLNLISNAIKYSDKEEPIEINIEQKKSSVSFCFKDYGIGISNQDIEELFEPFHRGQNVENISGTGLGLSVLKKAVDLHKGKIEVESNLDKGSSFKVTLPNNNYNDKI